MLLLYKTKRKRLHDKNIDMTNLAMQKKLEQQRAIDVSPYPQNDDGHYILPEFYKHLDYCDAVEEKWIWSIGRHKKTGEIHASTNSDLYQNKNYDCLFLR